MSKNKNGFRYLKLGEQASAFHDPGTGVKIVNKQIFRFSTTDHGNVHTSKVIKDAIQSGHLNEVDEDDYDDCKEQVSYNGPGKEMDIITDGRMLPKENERPIRRSKKSQDSNSSFEEETEEHDDDDDDDEQTEEDEDEDEDEKGLNEEEETELAKLTEKANPSRKDKKRIKHLTNKKG